MGYKSATYVIFDGDKDMYAYRFMRGWKTLNHLDFDFRDAHELGSEITDRACEETVKRTLRQRFSAASQVIVLIGESTRNLYRFVRWELEVALDLGLPIIAVNLNKRCSLDRDRCPPILRGEYVVHVPFKMNAIKYAMDRFPTEFARASESAEGDRYYPAEIYTHIGVSVNPSGYTV